MLIACAKVMPALLVLDYVPSRGRDPVLGRTKARVPGSFGPVLGRAKNGGRERSLFYACILIEYRKRGWLRMSVTNLFFMP